MNFGSNPTCTRNLKRKRADFILNLATSAISSFKFLSYCCLIDLLIRKFIEFCEKVVLHVIYGRQALTIKNKKLPVLIWLLLG